EQQHDGDFQDEHPTVRLVMVQQLIQIIQSLQFAIDSSVPISEVEAGGNFLVNASQVPVAKELGDVGQFIAEACQVDPNLSQLAKNCAATAQSTHDEVAICPFEGIVQKTIIGFQLCQLKVSQFHDVERLIKVGPLIDNQGGIPIYDN